MASPDPEQPPRRQYDCVCLKFGSGQPHRVSHTAWYQHLASACTQEERQRIQNARLWGHQIESLPPLTKPSSTPDRDYSVPSSVRRADARRGLAKRARENRDPNEYVGRRKCARVRVQQPIEQAGPSNYGDQLANPSPLSQTARQNDGYWNDDNPPLHFDDQMYDAPPPPEEHDTPPPPPPEEHDASPPPPPPEEHDAPPPAPEEHDAPPPEEHNASPPPPPEEHDAPLPAPEEHDAPPPENHRIIYRRRTRPQIIIQHLREHVVIPKLKETMDFVSSLSTATLADPVAKLGPQALERLRNPPHQPLLIDNAGHRHSISIYLATEHSSEDAYEKIRRSTIRNFPGAQDVEDILSFHKVESLIAGLTGIEKIQHNMCPNSCAAFTGPYSDLEECPLCGASRWNEELLWATNGRSKVPAKRFTTIPLGPQLQALYRDPDQARHMGYLYERTQQILTELRRTGSISLVDDIAAGWDYLGAVLDGDIKKDDIVLMVSLDGAQLYESKQSDCWIYIWVILNLSPDKRYKKVHVCPGGFIPGPNKPKNIDSFLFIGLHHIAVLQREDLHIWDASEDRVFQSDLYLLFTTADGPGLVCWDGMVGHSGKNGCQVYCPTRGRRKIQGTHYYPALLKLRDNCAPGSDHPDINVFQLPLGGSGDYAHNLMRVVSAPSHRQWEIRRTETGITKPPLILGLEPSRSLSVPLCMTTDLMHLAGNLSDLLISLWRGTMECSGTDSKNSWDWTILRDEDTWTTHGQAVENAGMFIPGSFNHKPRNIANKINTDYKTWEFHLYIFGLAPALLYSVLPEPYWSNFCKLVCGIQIMSQHAITKQDLEHAYVLLCSWGCEFELVYYQLRQDRLHFIRPCVHQVLHLVTEAMHKGPPICYAQWTMERTIGNLGQEIRQPSKPHNVPTLSRLTWPPEDENWPSVTGQRTVAQGWIVTM